MKHVLPEEIHLAADKRSLSLHYAAEIFELTAEFLRVHSPSASVRGHGVGNAVLQTGKAEVQIVQLEAVGNYALKITFSDGHDSGLYDWDYLYRLAHQYDTMWTDYLAQLEAAGASRMPSAEPEKTISSGCASKGCSKKH